MKTFAPLCVVLVLSLMTGALALTDEVEQNSVAYSAELQNVLAGLPSEDYSGPAIEDLRFSSGGCVAIAYCGDTKSVADMVMAKLESTAAWKNKKLAIRPPDDYANVLERGAYDNLIFAFNDGTEIQASNCGGTTRSAIYLWDTSCQAARPGCMQDKLNVFKSGSQYLFTPVPISGPMDLNSLEFCSSFYDLKCGYMGSEIVEKNIFLAGVDKDSLEAVANLVFGNVDGTLAAADANGWTIQGQDTEGWASRSLGLPDGQDYEFRFKLDTSSGSPVGHSSDTGYVISLLGDGKFVGTHAGVPETVWTGLSCDGRQTNRLLLTYNWNIETISAICTKGTSGQRFKVTIDSIDEAKKIIYLKVEGAKANDTTGSKGNNGIKALGFKVNFPVTEGVLQGASSSRSIGLVKFDENADIGPWEMGDSKRVINNELVVATVDGVTNVDSLMVLVSTGESAQSVAVLVDDTTLTPWVTSQFRWQDPDSGKDVFAELIEIPLTQLQGGVHTLQVMAAQAGASETAEGVAVFTLRVQLQPGTLAATDANGWTIQGQDTEGWASRSLGLPDGQDYEFRFKLDTSSGSPVGHSSDTGYVISLLGDGKFVGTHAGVPETVWTGLSCDSRQTNRLLLTYNWNIETISAICTKGTSGLQFKVSVDSIDEAKKIIYIKVEEAKANDIIRSDVGNGIKAVGFKVNFPVTEGVFKGMSSSQHLGLVKFDENADIGPWEMGDSKRLSDNELVVATVELITDADSLMVLVSTGESAQSVAVLVDDTTLTPWVTSQLRWQDQDSGKDVFAELITIPLTQLRGGVHTVQVKSAQAGASETAEGVAVFTLRVQLQLTTKKFLYEGSRGIPLEGFSTYMTREVPGNIKSGIAYRFLPEGLNFTGDVTLNIKHDGQDFTNGSGIGVYRYEDAEIDRDCQVQILDQSTQSVVMGGLFELGDVQLIFASDALPSSTDITIQKLQLTCNDAVLVAADQTGDGTEAPVASPKKGADNTWIIVALIVVVLLMGVYWFRKSKSK